MVVKAYLFLCSRLDPPVTNCDNCANVTTSGIDTSLPVNMSQSLPVNMNGPVKTEIELTDIESLDGDDPLDIPAPMYRTQNSATFFTGNQQRPKSIELGSMSVEPFDNQSLIQSGLSNLLTNDKIAKMMKRAIGSNPASTFPPKRKRDDRQLAPGNHKNQFL